MGLNLHNTIPKGTSQFAIPSKAELRSDAKVSCPFCHKEKVAMSGSGTMEQHLYRGGFYMCEAGGKSIEEAKRLRLDEHFNVVHDKNVVDDDVDDDDDES